MGLQIKPVILKSTYQDIKKCKYTYFISMLNNKVTEGFLLVRGCCFVFFYNTSSDYKLPEGKDSDLFNTPSPQHCAAWFRAQGWPTESCKMYARLPGWPAFSLPSAQILQGLTFPGLSQCLGLGLVGKICRLRVCKLGCVDTKQTQMVLREFISKPSAFRGFPS